MEAFDEFVGTIAALRAPEGCPWDREQTHQSIAKNMLEEAYEAVGAIEEEDSEHLREELGDVLLQVVLQAQIAADEGLFTIEDVVADINRKIVRRHPHVFGTEAAFEAAGLSFDDLATEVTSAEDVSILWDQVKAHERKLKEERRAAKRQAAGLPAEMPAGLLDAVPQSQAALSHAQEISEKTVRLGFEWENTQDVWDKFYEEKGEFEAAPAGSEEAELEMGDLLFCLVNVARKEGIDAETALRKTCMKFRRRWESMEAQAFAEDLDITQLELGQLDQLWNKAKTQVG